GVCAAQDDTTSVDDDRIADVRHRVEPGDVFVAQAHAAVRDRTAELIGLLRAVDGVAVAEVEAVAAENLVEMALWAIDGRDDHGVAGYDHFSRRQLACDTAVIFDDRVAPHAKHAPAAAGVAAAAK